MKTDQLAPAIGRLFLEQAGLYLLFTIPAFLMFWVMGKRYFARRRIQTVRRATTRQLLTEIRNSAGFLAIYACVDALLLHSSETANAQVYTDLTQHGGVLYAALTCFLFFVIDDTYFYWSHRLMHHPWVYQRVHRVHHESVDTSPFTAYSFHPLEGLVELGSVVFIGLYACYLPVHIGALIAWQLGAVAFNVIGHMGYEVYPSWWNEHWLLKWKTPATHHNMHHEHFEGNYGLYFTWWDRWMGTEFKDYNSRYQHLFTRPPVPDDTEPTTVAPRPAAIRKQADGDEPHRPARANLYLPDGEQSMLVATDETLLAAALRQRIAVPYGCQRGRCGTCQARCVQGRVRSHTVGPLSPAQQRAGYFLMCQSYADSARLTITYTAPAP